jgi:hypothetical protein
MVIVYWKQLPLARGRNEGGAKIERPRRLKARWMILCIRLNGGEAISLKLSLFPTGAMR